MEKVIKYLEKHKIEYDRKYIEGLGPVLYVRGKERDNGFIPEIRIGEEKEKNLYYVRNNGWIDRDYPYRKLLKDIRDLIK